MLPTPTDANAVPARYQGVWVRTLLETPQGRDTTTWVHWLQTTQWHADLRVPTDLDRSQPGGLAQQQGFCGLTRITPAQGDEAEVCTWHRRIDFQPPRSTPDAGTMDFETAERVIERGVHGNYLEVWERLPESQGRRVVLERLGANGLVTDERLLIAGQCLMHVRPRSAPWPSDLRPDETLAEVIQRHPSQRAVLLDFEITFARLTGGPCGGQRMGQGMGQWVVERSTLPTLEGQALCAEPQRTEAHTAHIAHTAQDRLAGDWRIVEWSES
ncbi:MAG: hypothetical protein R3E42_13185 [Burkholderiaceae bacterium]